MSTRPSAARRKSSIASSLALLSFAPKPERPVVKTFNKIDLTSHIVGQLKWNVPVDYYIPVVVKLPRYNPCAFHLISPFYYCKKKLKTNV